jgi:hypothetical protein
MMPDATTTDTMMPDAMTTDATPTHETLPSTTRRDEKPLDVKPLDAIQSYNRHQMNQQTRQLEATKIYVAFSTY